MSAYDLVIAAALLTAPPGTPEQPPTLADWPGLQAALHQKAIEMEILDPREKSFIMARVEDFTDDLEILRRRYADLADVPLVADSERFPDRRTVNELIRFNRAYRKQLANRQVWESDRAHLIREAVIETDRLYAVWDAIRDARCDFSYVPARRQALKKLRELLGSEAYRTADLPPYVPDWRFVEVR